MLYHFDRSLQQTLRPVARKTFSDLGLLEEHLEKVVIENMARLIPENQLMVISKERKGQEAADIYALDKKGDLHLFELKRWQSIPQNVLQVLRYGQIFGQYDYEDLQTKLREYHKDKNIDLAQKHYECFEDAITSKLKESDFNRDQHLVVITDGLDQVTLKAIRYWKSKGLKIRSLVYRVYSVKQDLFMEFGPYNPEEEVLLDEPDGNYIVNTNLTWGPDAYKEMLAQRKASAWGDRRYGIQGIKRGDTVFLYHNRVGVIAFGKAQNGYMKNDEREEYYVPLKFDWQVDPDTERERAVSASELNDKLKSGYRFRQTVWSVPEDVAKAIRDIAARK